LSAKEETYGLVSFFEKFVSVVVMRFSSEHWDYLWKQLLQAGCVLCCMCEQQYIWSTLHIVFYGIAAWI